MDKMRNKIFVGCLALLLVMVVGYALFSQNLNISGTATAKGDFQVTPTCQPGIPTNLVSSAKSFFTQLDEAWVDENAYYDDSCTVSDNNINFQSSFKYPGARRYFTIKVTNTGSITAISSTDYNDYSSSRSGEACIDNNGNGIFDSDECYTDKTSLKMGEDIFDYEFFSLPFAIEDKSGNLIEVVSLTEEELSKYFDIDDNSQLKLEPGYSAYYLVTLGLDSKIGTENGGSFMYRLNVSEKITFTQPKAE